MSSLPILYKFVEQYRPHCFLDQFWSRNLWLCFSIKTLSLLLCRVAASLRVHTRILDILILQDKTLFGALEASNIVCWLVNQPIAKLDLFKSPDCRWICKTYVEYCYRNSATVRRLVQSPTLQSTIFCGVHSDSRGKGIRVSPSWPIWRFLIKVFCSIE